MQITKQDLGYEYSWTVIGNDDPKISGEPDSTMFNRHEGYEVLYLINKLGKLWNFKQKISLLKLERLIQLHLPSTVRSQSNVNQWIQTNWNNY